MNEVDDAIALAARIATGELGAREALEAAIDRCERVNPLVNAVCNQAYEPALERAQAIDAALVQARRDPARLEALRRERPLLGVPSLLKDLGPVVAAEDIPTSMGSRLFAGTRWPIDSELVTRYRRAGLVFFGRSTSPEMGISPSTEAVVYGGPTRNPWNTAHSAGGSSGGAAAAVMADIVTVAHASDGMGSIRIPATNCGLVGLKPSRGLMPAGPLAGEGWGGLATDHVVTRSVRDSALLLDRTAGPDLGAPHAAPPMPASYLGALDAGPARESALRVAFWTRTLDGDPIDPEVAAVVREAAELLAGMGHPVEEAAPRVDTLAMMRPVVDVVACGTAMAIDARLQARGKPLADGELEPVTRSAWEHARSIGGARYLAALSELHRIARQASSFFGMPARGVQQAVSGYDVWLCPVLAEPPALLGRFAMNRPDYVDYRIGDQGIVRYSPFTPLANVTGQPAISVPFGRSSAGLPIGIQLVGRVGEDATLLALAARIEAARPWPRRAPLALGD